MIPEDEAKELIKEKKEENVDRTEKVGLTTNEVVELMRQACAINDARTKDSGTLRGVSRSINALATHRENLLNGNAAASDFDISKMDRDEIEANFMQVAINKIKTS